MSARATMTMRATVSRNMNTTTTAWNREGPPSFVEIGVVACRAYTKKRTDKDDSGKSAVVGDLRALVPGNADVAEEDQLVIVDRLGQLQFGGPVLVETRVRSGGSGSRNNHYELGLRRHTASA